MRLPVWARALLAQVGGLVLAWLFDRTGTHLGFYVSLMHLVALQALLAVSLSVVLGLPNWWLPVQALFLPAVLAALSFDLPPVLYLAAFILLWLLFRSTTRERVPLYLSNRATCRALSELLPREQGVRFIDLGCGFGSTLAYLASRRLRNEYYGVESAPLSYLVSLLRLRRHAGVQVRFGDIWDENLERYDVVYAFLSPEPMPALWRKACAEMRPGSLLVSNSFAVPGVEPDETRVLDDARRTHLYLWRL